MANPGVKYIDQVHTYLGKQKINLLEKGIQ